MRLVIDPVALRHAVAWTARALPARPTSPILAGLLLHAEGEHLTVAAYDYGTSARASARADVAEPGRTVLPGKVLAEVVKALPDRPVELTSGGAEAVLTCGRAEFGLPTMPVEDYPSLPAIPESAGTLDATQLHHAISQVAVAASIDDTVPMLTGLRIETDGDTVTLAATDRYRLPVRVLNWKPRTTHQHTLVAPAHALKDLTKGLTGTAVLGIDDGALAVSTGDRTITLRLLENQFPNWRALFPNPDGYAATAHLPAEPFCAAVKRVALVRDRGTPVRLTFDGGQALIQAGGLENGRGREAIDVKHDGDPIEIAFEPKYLLDAVTTCEAETVVLAMTHPVKPAVFTPAHVEGFRHLLMPIRLA